MTKNDYWRMVCFVIKVSGCRCRVKWVKDDSPPDWQPWLMTPVDGYLETGSMGPVRSSEVEWIEIEAIESRRVGRLLPCARIDHSGELADQLSEHAIRYECVETGFRVLPPLLS